MRNATTRHGTKIPDKTHLGELFDGGAGDLSHDGGGDVATGGEVHSLAHRLGKEDEAGEGRVEVGDEVVDVVRVTSDDELSAPVKEVGQAQELECGE